MLSINLLVNNYNRHQNNNHDLLHKDLLNKLKEVNNTNLNFQLQVDVLQEESVAQL